MSCDFSLNNDSILEIKQQIENISALFYPILTALTDENGLWKCKKKIMNKLTGCRE